MNCPAAAALLQSIDSTIVDIDSVSGTNPLIDAYFAKFLAVYVCGIYEEAIENIVVDFVNRNTARQEIVTYMRKHLHKYFRNPNLEKLIELIGGFGNSTWKTDLRQLTSQGLALDSIVNNKNALAHGQMTTSTLSEIKSYYAQSRLVIERMDTLMI
ncbi:MAG: hypothetical protein A2854_01295 [Parcubacteria group bacterium RIFCSPHIGHO2_01_FULL_56_18]|nr:MAG: hypothetical protein A2854_01295 [Parcubacteria group bacterium RIFCSPHIGHO2_01_FULL_56_18]